MKPLYENLREPTPLGNGALCAIPPGGLGEVGRNMNALEHKGELLIVDCGTLLPEVYQPGVDLILPDFPWIADRLDDVVGMIITHGHEDHIGVIPYLMKLRDDIPIYGSDLTLAFIEPKLHERRLPAGDMRIVRSGDRLQLGPFELEFVQVTHPVPGTPAIYVRTGAGTVLITGNFRVDHQPPDRHKTDLAVLGRIGPEGVDLLMIDLTDSEVPGFTPSESEIGPILDRIIEEAEGQVVIATSTSYVYRVQQVMNATTKAGRHVAPAGRPVERNICIAAERSYFAVPTSLTVDANELATLPPKKHFYMVTGPQGEPRAALARVSAGSHEFVNLEARDTVVVAASLIPGNEADVNRTINKLTQLGAKVFHHGNARIHASGHACQGESLTFYNLVQPKNVIPTRGKLHYPVKSGRLTVSASVSVGRIAFTDGGVTVDLKNGQARILDQVPCELVSANGKSVGGISGEELEIRRILSSEGFIPVYAVVEHDSGMALSGPTIKAIDMAKDDTISDRALPDVEDTLKDAVAPGGKDPYVLQQAIRRILGRWVVHRLRRRPMIAPVVIEQ